MVVYEKAAICPPQRYRTSPTIAEAESGVPPFWPISILRSPAVAAAPAPIEAESVDLKEPPLPEPNGSFKRTASKPTAPPPTHVTKAQAEWMLHTLGCSLDEHTFTEIFDETDSDGDGRLELSEFITAMGMLKRNLLELIDLGEVVYEAS